jgi:hypothetical protein
MPTASPPLAFDGPIQVIPLAAHIIVRWRTTTQADSQLRYGATCAVTPFSVMQTVTTTQHSLVLSGLTPAMQYCMQVRSTNAQAETGWSADLISTTLKTESRVHFPSIKRSAP